MAEGTERRTQAKKKPRRGHDDAAKPRSKQRKKPEQAQNSGGNDVKGLQFSMAGVMARVLPVLSLALALTAIVLLYRRFMPRVATTSASETAAVSESQPAASNSKNTGYEGVEDSWSSAGYFTTGNKDLDLQVKQFCDAHTVEGNSAASNAKNAFNTIVWSEVEERTENQEPNGDEWAIVSAKHYFSGGSPEDGIGGIGDEYEFAAATSYCLQYFGYSDAWAIPIIREDAYGGQGKGALVVVTDDNGQKCVCDPALAGNGWMVSLSEYDLLVENIGQDLKKVEERGLTVQKDDLSQQSSSTGSGRSSGQSGQSSSSSSDDYAEYSEYSEYGYY